MLSSSSSSTLPHLIHLAGSKAWEHGGELLRRRRETEGKGRPHGSVSSPLHLGSHGSEACGHGGVQPRRRRQLQARGNGGAARSDLQEREKMRGRERWKKRRKKGRGREEGSAASAGRGSLARFVVAKTASKSTTMSCSNRMHPMASFPLLVDPPCFMQL
ncbi:hypothetical protein VPH35_072857 [Triticum aestivum]